MSTNSIDVFDTTVQKTNEWLRDIASELGDDNRRHAYLALRGTLHAVRDFLPVEESAQLSPQLPMLVRGIYFEGWDSSDTSEVNRSRENCLSRTENALERAPRNDDSQIDAEQSARAVPGVLSSRISPGKVEQARPTRQRTCALCGPCR